MTDSGSRTVAGDRLAKVMARAGKCSRRDAEDWIKAGRVTVNGAVIRTPAFNVTPKDQIGVDGAPLAARSGTRVWLYHKPAGLVVTERDPEGRPTIFEKFEAAGLPRVLTVGRLDLNTEGLLLLTNDGGLKRVLELPATGWLRRYRVRAFGTVAQPALDRLKHGVEIEGIKYGPIEALLERQQGANTWLVVSLREGKNREVKNVLASLGLTVNRLIRVSYGPFQLGDLPVGGIEVVKARVLRDQLGKKLAAEANVDFDSEMPEATPLAPRPPMADPTRRVGAAGKAATARRPARRDEPARPHRKLDETERPIQHRPGRGDPRPPRKPRPEAPQGPLRRILFDDGRQEEFRPEVPREKRDGAPGDKPGGRHPAGRRPHDAPDGARSASRPARADGARPPRRDDRPARADGARPPRRDDRPARADGARPPRRDDRPARADGARPPRRDDRPVRADGARPPRRDDRPARADGARPARPASGPRDGDRRAPAGKGPRPGSSRPAGARPTGARPTGSRPAGARPAGPPRGPRPGGKGPPRKPRS